MLPPIRLISIQALALALALPMVPIPARAAEPIGHLLFAEIRRFTAPPAGGGSPPTVESRIPQIALAHKVLHPAWNSSPNDAPGELAMRSARFQLNGSEAGDARRLPGATDAPPRYHTVLDHLGFGLLGSTGPGPRLEVASGQMGSVVVEGGLVLSPASGTGSVTVGDHLFFPTLRRDGRKGYAVQIEAPALIPSLVPIEPFKTGGAAVGAVAVAGATEPAISPDGKWLAYVKRGTGPDRLVIAEETSPDTPKCWVDLSGDRRFGHPSWRWDNKALAVASNYNTSGRPDRWSVYGIRLDLSTASGDLGTGALLSLMGTPPSGVPASGDGGGYQCIAPSFSPDGRFVAFSLKPYYTAPATLGDKSFQLVAVEVKDDMTVRAGQVLTDASADHDRAWVHWYQDLFPPSLRVELVPSDSSASNVIELVAPIDSTDLEHAKARIRVEGSHFSRRMDTMVTAGAPGTGTPPTPAGTDLTLGASSGSLPLSYWVHLSNGVDYVAARGSQLPARAAVADPVLAPVQGIYVNRNIRIAVKVSARDDQMLRPYPVDNVVEDDPAAFLPGDPRSGAPFQRPFLPTVSRDDALAFKPGLSWWWEDAAGEILDRSLNATEYTCRSDNFSGDEAAAKPKILYFRAMAHDLWRNRTELTVPVFVWNQEIRIDRLTIQQRKK